MQEEKPIGGLTSVDFVVQGFTLYNDYYQGHVDVMNKRQVFTAGVSPRADIQVKARLKRGILNGKEDNPSGSKTIENLIFFGNCNIETGDNIRAYIRKSTHQLFEEFTEREFRRQESVLIIEKMDSRWKNVKGRYEGVRNGF